MRYTYQLTIQLPSGEQEHRFLRARNEEEAKQWMEYYTGYLVVAIMRNLTE